MRDSYMTFNLSTVTLVKILIVMGALGFLYLIRDVVAVLFVALVIASALMPAIKTMERYYVPRILGILLIFLSFLAVITLAIVLIIPPLTAEYSRFMMHLPAYSESITRFFQALNPSVDIVDGVKTMLRSFQSTSLQFAGGIVLKIFDILTGIFALFVVFVSVFYMVLEERALRRGIHFLTPATYRDYVDHLITKVQNRVGLWLRGQMILSVVIFIFIFLGLTILGVDYALLLAFVAGLTEFMPIIGPIIAAIPAIFIAFNQSPTLALWTLLLYWLIQYLENNLLVPRIMQKAVGLNPLGSIIALLIGGKIGGIFGILLAIPVATIITTIGAELIGRTKEE